MFVLSHYLLLIATPTYSVLKTYASFVFSFSLSFVFMPAFNLVLNFCRTHTLKKYFELMFVLKEAYNVLEMLASLILSFLTHPLCMLQFSILGRINIALQSVCVCIG